MPEPFSRSQSRQPSPSPSRAPGLSLLFLFPLLWAAPLAAQDPLSLTLNQRSRFESVTGRLPGARSDNDQVLALRTSLLADYRTDRLRLVGELLDSRQYLADSDSMLNNTVVNTSDILQAYVQIPTPALGGAEAAARLRAGRFTKDIHSRRLFARNGFRNTINAYSGFDWLRTSAAGELGAFFLVPVDRLPGDRASLEDNEFGWDREQESVHSWGLHAAHNDLGRGLAADALLIAIDERDDGRLQTRDRDYLTLDLRLFRDAAPGLWDFEFEIALQDGEVSRSNAPNAATVDHEAQFYHAQVGYSFPGAWQVNVKAQVDYASGDSNGSDVKDEQFDTLFGARRFDFGPTGIYGPFVRSNLYSPGLRLSARPAADVTFMAAHRHYWTAERPATGERFQGRQTEFSIGWQTLIEWLQVETGGAHLYGANGREDVNYFYLQLNLSLKR